MESKELRIGNYIQLRGVRNVMHPEIANWSSEKCNIYHLKDINHKNKDWEYKPIPLTEDWLLKFGFSGQPCNYAKDKLSICLKGSDNFHKEGRTYFNSWAILEKQPKFVHELQNLFFALTAQELEI